MKTRINAPKLIPVFAAMAAAGALSTHTQAQCHIDMGANQQTIDGYGFSTAWCGQLSSAQFDTLMGTGGGQLGFTILRCRIDPNNGWTDETANASKAHARGAKVMGTPWSPPPSMKDNNNVVHGHLLPAHYGDFANWLHSAANSIGLDYVSVQNEPDWDPNYEGCVWTGDQLHTFCLNNAPAIGKPVIMPEAVNFQDQYSDPTLNDATAASHVTFIAGHFYGGGNYVHQNALNKGKHVWETEYYINGTDMGTAISVAQSVSDAMNNQFSVYNWWWVMPNDPASFINGTTVDKRGYVLGQFAHWVRPGSNRVNADHNPQSNVSVTAYKVNGNLVIVAINANTYNVSQQFSIANGSVGSMEGYRTSSGENMADVGNFNVSGGSFTPTLNAQSVTTFVQTSGGGGPANGTYKLIARHSGKAMDVYGGGTANGTQIIQWTYHSANNQQWTITSLGGGLYKVISVASGKTIDISNWGTANGTKVQIWDYLGGTNQKFYFNSTGGGYYEISPSYVTGSCLDVSGASTADGANVQLWQWLGGNNQQWAPQAP